jgi:ATP-binding cassette, subfamily B, bacterial
MNGGRRAAGSSVLASGLGGLWAMAATAYSSWPLGAVVVPLAAVLVRSVPLATAVLLGSVVDAAVAGDGARLQRTLLLAAAVAGTTGVLSSIWMRGRTILAARANQALRERVLCHALDREGIAHLESPEYADRSDLLLRHGNPGLILERAVHLAFSSVVVVIGLLAIARVDLAAGLCVLTAVAVSAAHGRLVELRLRGRVQASRAQRLRLRLFELATGRAGAKEMRLFDLGLELLRRHRDLTDVAVRELVAARWRSVALAGAAGAIRSGAVVAAVLLMMREATTGTVTPGAFVFSLYLLRTSLDTAVALGNDGGGLLEQCLIGEQALKLMSAPSTVARSPRPRPVREVQQGICFEGVSFTYPETDRPVLDDLSFSLPAGSTVAMVGVNGSGKTTIVKLIARLYDPTHGRICVDGVDLRDLDLDGWRRSISVVFQDYAHYEFTAREAIGIGHLPVLYHDHALWAAVRSGGAQPLVHALRKGLSTQLGTDHPNGAELSEGQWQRIGIARGLIRPRPLLVVLDEPTARIDPIAEQDLLERYREGIRESRRTGQITLVISHRLAMTDLADAIVVLDAGKVVEVGTHAELLAAKGRYAALFHATAERGVPAVDPVPA